MEKTRAPEPAPFTRELGVETPEHVMLQFQLAGLGSRAAAAVYDTAILVALLFLGAATWTLVARVPDLLRGWAGAVSIAVVFLVTWGYFVLFEALADGRTPGKRRLGIRVVMDTGHRVTFAAAAIRNLVRLVDAQPGVSYLVGLLFVWFHPQHKRLGDIVAGTVVVRDRPEDLASWGPPAPDAARLEAGAPQLADDEYRYLERVLERLDALPDDVRRRFLADLERRFGPRYPSRHPDPAVFLAKLYEGERERRRGVLAAGPAAPSRRTPGRADRFVALKQASWERFRHRAAAAERRGVKHLTGEELTAFAAAYREVAADLARARTYGVDARVREQLERLVSMGHNVLYGARAVRRPRLGRLLMRRFPAAVYRARAYVLSAALLFTAPAAAGYGLIRERPAAAHEILPDAMIARAEAGRAQAGEGRGYAQAPSPYLPMFASGIIANNVQVAFAAFAFGITAGLGTVLVLAINGLFFGAVLGTFAEYGLAGWLLTFVAGHGVLELTAIFVAGGGGLLVARAVIAPGDLGRRDALVLHGRVAIELVGAAASLLVVAGVIEGFVSASAAPAALKLSVSAASAAFLWLYFRAGRRATENQGQGSGARGNSTDP